MKTKRAWMGFALSAAAVAVQADEEVRRGSSTILVPGDFATLQAAVDAAGPGDAIVVQGGTYGPLVISGRETPGLQIYGDYGAAILGDAAGPAVTIQGALDVGIHGLTVIAQGDGVVVTNSAHVSIDGMTVSDADGDGFRVVGSQSVQIALNVVDGATGAGVRVVESHGVMVQSNAVSGVGGDGVSVEGGHGVSACSNTIQGCGDDGVACEDTTELVVDENVVRDAGGDGLDVADADWVYVGGNWIDAGEYAGAPIAGDGIRVVGSTDVKLENNSVQGVFGDGMFVDSDAAQLNGTTVGFVGGSGIVLAADDVLVTQAAVDGVGGAGIDAAGNGVKVLTSTVVATGGDGIVVVGEGADLTANRVEQAGGAGIVVAGGQSGRQATVADSGVFDCGGTGVDLGDTCGAKVTGNVIMGSDEHGIAIGAGDANFLHRNKAKKNGRFDFYEAAGPAPNRVDKTNKFKRTHRRGRHHRR